MFTNGTRYTFKSKAFEKISLQSLVASNTTTSSVQNQSLANFYNRYSLLNSNEIEPKLITYIKQHQMRNARVQNLQDK